MDLVLFIFSSLFGIVEVAAVKTVSRLSQVQKYSKDGNPGPGTIDRNGSTGHISAPILMIAEGTGTPGSWVDDHRDGNCEESKIEDNDGEGTFPTVDGFRAMGLFPLNQAEDNEERAAEDEEEENLDGETGPFAPLHIPDPIGAVDTEGLETPTDV